MKLILINLLYLLSSCTTYSLVRVKTSPENSQISIRQSDGSLRVLGKGQIEMSSSEFFSMGSRMAKLEVSYENFKTQSLYIIQGKSAESYEIFVNLDRDQENGKSAETRSRMEKLGKLLAKASGAIYAKKYSEAETVLNILVSEFPAVSAVYDLRGNLYYLQKNIQSALQNYQRSYQINPENMETKGMIDRLSKMTNGDQL